MGIETPGVHLSLLVARFGDLHRGDPEIDGGRSAGLRPDGGQLRTCSFCRPGEIPRFLSRR